MKSENRNKIAPANTSTDGELTFTCPDCGGTDLCLTHLGLREVTFIYADGDAEFGAELPDDENLAYVCINCELILEDDDGDLVCHQESLVQWIKENCL